MAQLVVQNESTGKYLDYVDNGMVWVDNIAEAHCFNETEAAIVLELLGEGFVGRPKDRGGR